MPTSAGSGIHQTPAERAGKKVTTFSGAAMMRPMDVRILVTGGTFDKDYDERTTTR
jgi:hypothetical protein